MASSRIPNNPFRFLGLPKELRIMVYERLPRTIDNKTVSLSYENLPPHHKRPMSFFTLVHRSTTTSLLCVCKKIFAEAAPFIHKTVRNFILEASPKVAGTLHPDYLDDVLGPLMRAAARDFDHLRTRFGFSRDGKPTILVPSLDNTLRGCLYLAIRYLDYDELQGSRQHAAPGDLIDYTSKNKMSVFLRHLAEARETKAEWDIEDLPEQTLNSSALFLPGSVKVHVVSIPHKSAIEATKRAISMFITTASIQLLHHHIKRVSHPALGNPCIDFVNCFPKHELKIHCIGALRCGDLCTRRMLHAFQVQGHRSICYDFGIHVKLGGYVIVEEGQQPLLRENAIMELPVQGSDSTFGGWDRLGEPVDGVGSVVICQEPMTREEWAEEWLANDSRRDNGLS